MKIGNPFNTTLEIERVSDESQALRSPYQEDLPKQLIIIGYFMGCGD